MHTYSPQAQHHPSPHFITAAPTTALLVDAAGTLLHPSEPAAAVYRRYALQHGVSLPEQEILARYRRAYNTPWGRSPIRFVDDGRDFWRFVVGQATLCDSPELFEKIYDYYAQPAAWRLTPGAVDSLGLLKANGYKLAVVSNFDTRLRPLLQRMGIGNLFDEVVVSAEVGVEKPNPVIFEHALQRLGCSAEEVIHVGDDRRNDVWGARDAGIHAWLWGVDVTSFRQVADRLMHGVHLDDEDYAEQQQAVA